MDIKDINDKFNGLKEALDFLTDIPELSQVKETLQKEVDNINARILDLHNPSIDVKLALSYVLESINKIQNIVLKYGEGKGWRKI